jgi:hypothetical protein
MPTRSPEVSTRPALSDLVIGADGLGNLKVGQPVPAEDPSTSIVRYDPAYCRDVPANDPHAAGWTPLYDDTRAFLVYHLPTRRGAVVQITVISPLIHTSTGIHIGSSRAAVLAAYPSVARIIRGELSDVYVISGKVGYLTIEVSNDDAAYWSAAGVNKVIYLQSYRADLSQYIEPIAAGEFAICP